jgi:ketosteroid isomerase-like protein
MKTLFLSLALLTLVSFDSLNYKESDANKQVDETLDAWHKAAAEANAKVYFGMMTDDAIFIGTDATENWNLKAFQAFAKPYFDRGKAWDFKAIERHIYFDKSGKLAWFDELLNTQMKICRGSGVMVKIGKEWKIKHYVLSMTIPNEKTNEVVKIKEELENSVIKNLESKKE